MSYHEKIAVNATRRNSQDVATPKRNILPRFLRLPKVGRKSGTDQSVKYSISNKTNSAGLKTIVAETNKNTTSFQRNAMECGLVNDLPRQDSQKEHEEMRNSYASIRQPSKSRRGNYNNKFLNEYIPNEAPPAYNSMASSKRNAAPACDPASNGEDRYEFLANFDTILLIDDSSSMAGRSWHEVELALSTIVPIVTRYDDNGIDIYFLNHHSTCSGAPNDGVAAGGYPKIKSPTAVQKLFREVTPCGATPTGTRIYQILRPYMALVEKQIKSKRDAKPINLIVLTDGMPTDDVETVILMAAKKLDKLEAPPFQLGVQFFQVGNEAGAAEALKELDDSICNMVEGTVRDIVDTVTWTGGQSSRGLTGDSVLKVVLGSVVKRLDRKRASGEVSRGCAL